MEFDVVAVTINAEMVGAVLSSILTLASCPAFIPSVNLANTISPWFSPVTLVPVVHCPSVIFPFCHSMV